MTSCFQANYCASPARSYKKTQLQPQTRVVADAEYQKISSLP